MGPQFIARAPGTREMCQSWVFPKRKLKILLRAQVGPWIPPQGTSTVMLRSQVVRRSTLSLGSIDPVTRFLVGIRICRDSSSVAATFWHGIPCFAVASCFGPAGPSVLRFVHAARVQLQRGDCAGPMTVNARCQLVQRVKFSKPTSFSSIYFGEDHCNEEVC